MKKNLIPQIRFPEFKKDGEWEEKKLGTISEITTGNSNREDSTKDKDKYTFFDRSEDIRTSNRFLFDGEAIIIAGEGQKFTPKYFIGKFDLHQRAYTIMNFGSNYIGKFLFYFIFKNSNYFLRYAVGSTVKSLRQPIFENMPVLTPKNSKEQQKIAHFFSTIDDKINQLQNKKNALQQYKKGVMQKIFAAGEKSMTNSSITNSSITNYELENDELNDGKIRNSSFVIPDYIRFKDDNGQDYPDWETKKLGEVAKVYDGTHQTPKYKKRGIPFYSVEHVTANNFSKTKFISEEVFVKENKRVKLEKGDILMTRIGDIGTAKYIDWDVNASFYVSLALIKQNENYKSKYFYQFISSSFFQNELWKKTIHVAFPKKINLGEISTCLTLLPSLKEQTKIANFLTKIDSKITNCELQIMNTKEYKKGLLQKMLA